MKNMRLSSTQHPVFLNTDIIGKPSDSGCHDLFYLWDLAVPWLHISSSHTIKV